MEHTTEYIGKRQEQLFSLLSKYVLLAHGSLPEAEIQCLDRMGIVRQLLALSSNQELEEDQSSQSFASVLASPRGAESECVFTVIDEVDHGSFPCAALIITVSYSYCSQPLTPHRALFIVAPWYD